MQQHPPTAQRPPRCPASIGPWACPRSAGFGTDHPGTGKCRQHELQAAAGERIPPATFHEPRYLDGLTYHETAGGEAPEDWETVA